MRTIFVFAMAGLVPAIQIFLENSGKDVDARDKRGHDVDDKKRRLQ